jgi:hypothetical protein
MVKNNLFFGVSSIHQVVTNNRKMYPLVKYLFFQFKKLKIKTPHGNDFISIFKNNLAKLGRSLF